MSRLERASFGFYRDEAVLAILVALFGTALPVPAASAESKLPPCPAIYDSATWTNCSGAYTLSSGAKYVGEWLNGTKHGHGTYTWPNGAQYVGDYIDDKRHGHGNTTLPDGSRYVGEYCHDKEHGQGTFYDSDGAILKDRTGTWADGKFLESTKVATIFEPCDDATEDRRICAKYDPEYSCTEQLCADDKADPDRVITACTRLLVSGPRADLFLKRGRIYLFEKKNAARAIADLNNSIALYAREESSDVLEDIDSPRPQSDIMFYSGAVGMAYHFRANAYHYLAPRSKTPEKYWDFALADYAEALNSKALDNAKALMLRQRAEVYEEKGDADLAKADLAKAAQLEDK
jgi:hypothetical protein